MCTHAHTHQPKRTAKKTQNSLNAFNSYAGSKQKKKSSFQRWTQINVALMAEIA